MATAKINHKEYRRGEMLEVRIGQHYLPVIGFSKKRVITKYGKFHYAEIEGWSLPWGSTFQPNLHMIAPLCNRANQGWW